MTRPTDADGRTRRTFLGATAIAVVAGTASEAQRRQRGSCSEEGTPRSTVCVGRSRHDSVLLDRLPPKSDFPSFAVYGPCICREWAGTLTQFRGNFRDLVADRLNAYYTGSVGADMPTAVPPSDFRARLAAVRARLADAAAEAAV